MTCRNTPSGSAFTSYARLVNGRELTDPETLSVFHELRSWYNERDPEARRTYTREDYDALLERQISRVETMGGVTEARRNSILERLREAQQEEMPEQSIVYALHNLTPQVRSRARNMRMFCDGIATRMGIPYEEVQRSFREYADSVDRSRAARNRVRSQANIDRATQHGLGREAGVLHATAMLTEQAEQVEIARARSAPQLVVRNSFDVPAQTGIPGVTITEAGYDSGSGRLEVVVTDSYSGETTTHTYRGVPESVGRTIASGGSNGSGGSMWADLVRGRSEYSYPDEHTAALGGVAPRCGTCGQFANSEHSCPTRVQPVALSRWRTRSRWSNQNVDFPVTADDGTTQETQISVQLPAIREFRETFANGPVQIQNMHQYFRYFTPDGRWQHASSSGGVIVSRDPDTNEIQVNPDPTFRCSCPEWRTNGHCPHIDMVASAIRRRLDPPPRSPRSARTPEERERLLAEQQRRAEQAAATDWTRQEETLAEARRTWRQNSDVIYSEDFAAFETDYNAALAARTANGDGPVIPYMKGDDVLDGMAQRGSGQGFGIELEYEFPNEMGWSEKLEANRRIGEELYAAGLTSSESQQPYGTAKRRGFRDTHQGNWSWEHDGSVNGGELVTPVMYDEEDTWNNLEKVVDIMRRNGAVPTRRAGAHIHVGTGAYRGDPTKYTELARLTTQHEDVMFRLAACPERGTHRMTNYTRPNNEVPDGGFAEIRSMHNWQGGRTTSLNMTSVSGDDKDHVEFRIFDASLDAGTIQSQVKLSLAMVNAASAHAETGGTKRKKEVLGSHAERGKVRGRRRMTSEDLKEDTATTRSLLDTLFRRREDKTQLVAVFANTKWSKKSARTR